MAWTTPKTDFDPGDVLTAAEMNAIGDNLVELAPFFGAWQSWTPTLTQGVAVTFTNTDSKYLQVGSLVIASSVMTITGTGTLNQTIVVGFGSGGTAIPTSASSTTIFGAFTYFDSGNTNYTGYTRASSTTAVQFNRSGNGNPFGSGDAQCTNNDIFRLFFVYEAA